MGQHATVMLLERALLKLDRYPRVNLNLMLSDMRRDRYPQLPELAYLKVNKRVYYAKSHVIAWFKQVYREVSTEAPARYPVEITLDTAGHRAEALSRALKAA